MAAAVLTEHALRRWLERVMPGASRESAGRALQAFLATATYTREPPPWALRRGWLTTTRGWYATHVDRPGVAVALDELPRSGMSATTVLTETSWADRRSPKPMARRRLPKTDKAGAVIGGRTSGRASRLSRARLEEFEALESWDDDDDITATA